MSNIDNTEAAAISVEAAAEYLGVCRHTVYKAVRSGEIRAVRLGRRWLVPRAELAALLNGNDARGVEVER